MTILTATVLATAFYPGVSLTVTQDEPNQATIEWSSTSATKCYASWTSMGEIPLAGKATLPIAAPTLLTVYCDGTQAMYVASGSPTWSPGPPPTGWPGTVINEPLSLYVTPDPAPTPNAPTKVTVK